MYEPTCFIAAVVITLSLPTIVLQIPDRPHASPELSPLIYEVCNFQQIYLVEEWKDILLFPAVHVLLHMYLSGVYIERE